MRIGKMIIRQRMMTAGAILWETMMISMVRVMRMSRRAEWRSLESISRTQWAYLIVNRRESRRVRKALMVVVMVVEKLLLLLKILLT